MTKRQVIIVTCALLLSNAMSGLDNTIINTALPAIVSDLHGIELIGWVVSVFLLGTAISTPLWSKLGEYIGNKRCYQLSVTIFALGSFFSGFSSNMWMLIIARTFMGIGNGGMVSVPYIIYSRLYENPRKRMQVLGFVSASYSMATILGPLVGGYIVDVFNWHWIFYISVPIAIISIVIIQYYYHASQLAEKNTKVDYLGAVLMTAGLFCLLLAIELIGDVNYLMIGGLIVLSIGLLAIMLRVENRVEDPIIPNRLFKNRSLVIDFITFALVWGSFIGFLIYSPMWAQGLLGTSALIGGMTQIPGSVTDFIGSGAVAPLRRYITPQQVVGLGLITLIICFMLMVFCGIHAPYWLLLLAGAFEGFGNGACFNELQVKVQQDAIAKDVPAATSFSFLVRMLSQSFTASIFGIILNNALRAGVKNSGGTITMKMMNQLSNVSTAKKLPRYLIPQMQTILHTGLHNIMLVALIIMLCAGALNIWAQGLERTKIKLKGSLYADPQPK
ncbi:MFS transporter [Lentilactobacillus sp. SPB1-3]|uniref:MFS transporter n=1 Tax=Lentilactobacillus terminaliae TaxID=3003483 RepID=A0ACD5DFX4_9LACO|nr:MFS transporter [Lentilactobacillus sp. SPB1-3]MCZ0976370.1 MFS transporter [Lentilactobacillus sp. SPB1-3]